MVGKVKGLIPVAINLLLHEVHGDRPCSRPASAEPSRINYRSVGPLVHTGQWSGGSPSRPQIGNNAREKIRLPRDSYSIHFSISTAVIF